MYYMYTIKNNPLPGLIHAHVDLGVHLDPQDGLELLRNHKIWITMKNRAINMFILPVLLELRIKLNK